MSKTFGDLKAGDEVYIIKGCNVEIVKVSMVGESPIEAETWASFGGVGHSIPSDLTSFYDNRGGCVCCDIDEAMRAMQDICAKALHDYKEASGALNKLETLKRK